MDRFDTLSGSTVPLETFLLAFEGLLNKRAIKEGDLVCN